MSGSVDLEENTVYSIYIVMTALMIDRDAEGRIFGGEPRQRLAHLFLVALGLRLDRDLDDRVGEFHALQDDRMRRVGQRVAGRGVLQAGQRQDVAGARLLDVLA